MLRQTKAGVLEQLVDMEGRSHAICECARIENMRWAWEDQSVRCPD